MSRVYGGVIKETRKGRRQRKESREMGRGAGEGTRGGNLSEHITLVKGCIEASPDDAGIRGEVDEHVLSSRPDGPRDLSSTENC